MVRGRRLIGRELKVKRSLHRSPSGLIQHRDAWELETATLDSSTRLRRGFASHSTQQRTLPDARRGSCPNDQSYIDLGSMTRAPRVFSFPHSDPQCPRVTNFVRRTDGRSGDLHCHYERDLFLCSTGLQHPSADTPRKDEARDQTKTRSRTSHATNDDHVQGAARLCEGLRGEPLLWCVMSQIKHLSSAWMVMLTPHAVIRRRLCPHGRCVVYTVVRTHTLGST